MPKAIEKRDKYFDTFPKTLRRLLDRHPVTGKTTTMKELAEYCHVKPQTISLYSNGSSDPSPRVLIALSEYFQVSIDYLLKGVRNEDKCVSEELGLSGSSIEMLKKINRGEDKDKPVKANKRYIINAVLSDAEFYELLGDCDCDLQKLTNCIATDTQWADLIIKPDEMIEVLSRKIANSAGDYVYNLIEKYKEETKKKAEKGLELMKKKDKNGLSVYSVPDKKE